MQGWIKNRAGKTERVKIEEDFERAYTRIIDEVNKCGAPKQLIAMLNKEHPTLKMSLLRALIRSVNESDIQYDETGKVRWHDGRIGKDVVEFAGRGTIPFI